MTEFIPIPTSYKLLCPCNLFVYYYTYQSYFNQKRKKKMCRGLEESKRGSVFEEVAPSNTNTVTYVVICELCSSAATVYCQADDAYLCRKCDQWVHGANFLARRHIRCFLCKTCQKLTKRYLIGASVEMVLPSLVISSQERRSQCDSVSRTKCSRTLKRPFLFLWVFFFFWWKSMFLRSWIWGGKKLWRLLNVGIMSLQMWTSEYDLMEEIHKKIVLLFLFFSFSWAFHGS